VAADVEEGATVAEAVLEVGQVVADAVKGTKPPDEAGGDLFAGGPSRNLTPLAAALCPTVGANSRGNLETVATVETRGPARDYAYSDTTVYPGSGPSRVEVNPYFLPASY
jgi:hypothetical protein